MNTYLILENNLIFEGIGFGSIQDKSESFNIIGEVVFQTGMVGYPEILTDPSHKNHILVLTYPLIGNYGVPSDDKDQYGLMKYLESNKIHISGLIIQEKIDDYSHWNANISLNEWLKINNVPGIYGIDTRELTKVIREHGVLLGQITNIRNNRNDSMNLELNKNISIDKVCIKNPIIINPNGKQKVMVIDCGIKHNQLKMLLKRNVKIKMVPWDYNFVKDEFLDNDCSLLISNGPGDPTEYKELISNISNFIKIEKAKFKPISIFGICLGHQILALANNAKTFKMKYGNRGHNIPCQLLNTNKCYITSQNHGYGVIVNIDIDQNTKLYSSNESEEWKPLFTNMNDGTNEGMYHIKFPWFSVQFHPEAKGGPKDTEFLFDIFLDGTINEYVKNQNQIPIIKTIKKKILILGSGGLSIGQSGEFDYSGSQAIKAYKEEGLTTVLINPNIATIQTSPDFADKVYFDPIDVNHVTQIIKLERPDCITLSFGGQVALNCGIELDKLGILNKYNVKVLGTKIESIICTEDRNLFKNKIESINENIPKGLVAENIDDAIIKGIEIGFPLLVRAAFALGGLGSGFANNLEELKELLEIAFSHSNQVIIDKSLKGWKEIEYEIIRDSYDNCVVICNMENIDPLGVHTGESIVVAPSQTLTDEEYNMLRSVAIKVVKSLEIIGECNIQYALNPLSKEYYIIEVNARLSRSSALASKATGYPLAYIAAKLSLGNSLLELKNSITKKSAFFEPSLDYCVVKIPRWDLKKFPMASTKIDSSMKSIGESMAISRGFEEAFQKAIRMSNDNILGFEPQDNILGFDNNILEFNSQNSIELEKELEEPTYERLFIIANVLYNNKYSIEELNKLTGIDKWFLHKMNRIIKMKKKLEKYNESLSLPKDLLYNAKKLGFSDRQIAKCIKSTELAIRISRSEYNIYPAVKQIDTVSAEYPCYTNYLYTTYNGIYHDTIFEKNHIIVLGSGVYRIGSSVEFDWCAVNCINELRKLNYKTIVINCNPETVSTDYDEADKLYFDELSFEVVMDIYELECPLGIILSMGGQIPNNIAMALHKQKVKVIGTSPDMIDKAENRFKFSRMLEKINVDQPKWKKLSSFDDAKIFCNKVGYPCLIRPSYVLSGIAMNVAYSDIDLEEYLKSAIALDKIRDKTFRDCPVVISKFINDAKEIEVDAVANNGIVKLVAISEHVENAGVHSGDATLVLPSYDLTYETIEKIKYSVFNIAKNLQINGPFNIQFIAKNNKVKVIECNLRVSRSFPFASKTLGINFVRIATRFILNENVEIPETLNTNRIGVKVAQFSFNRLKGTDIRLGVEMLSTGEVACFGRNHLEAYLKALQASKFILPKKTIFLSIGSYKFKQEFLGCARILENLGYQLYGSRGSADFYQNQGINIKELIISNKKQNDYNNENLFDKLREKKIDLVINISKKNKIKLNDKTLGYKLRRLAIDNSIPVITDIKQSKLFVESLQYYLNNKGKLRIRTDIDCFTSYKTITLPGLIDVHVHVREPGHEYKEDWTSCTMAAIAGGITTIFAMPNTNPPIIDNKTIKLVKNLAKNKSCCDYGIFVGASKENSKNIFKISNQAIGLKMYLNNTYGPLLLDEVIDWIEHVKNWDINKPICVHAESKILPAILHIGLLYKKHIHVCHVARKEEIEIIKQCKLLGHNITCEVTPHHLFMTIDDKQKICDNYKTENMESVKPPLMTLEDQQALWENLNIIDCFATDHAPHSIQDKKNGSPGFASLETALPLLLTAVNEGKLKINDIVEKYYENPIKIFNLRKQPHTFIEIDMDKEWILPKKPIYSKCGWSPYANRKVTGQIKRVVLRGKTVFIDGKVIAKPGIGRDVISLKSNIKSKKIISDKSTLSTDKLNNLNNKKSENINDNSNITCMIKNIVTVDQFDRQILRNLFDDANKMKLHVEQHKTIDILKNKIMVSMFYEPSTRTRCSFDAAMKRLGGQVINVQSSESSVKKGESLEDSIKCLECYSDIIVLRTADVNSIEKIANILTIPLINAGDGIGEHPTQALLDVYTIRDEMGTVNNLTITLVGDLKNGRTVHSLAKLLSLYNVKLNYVSPKTLKMPKHIKNIINSKNIKQFEYENLEDVLCETDVLYITRIQKERFENIEEYNKLFGFYKLTPKLLRLAKDEMIIMHPFPRINEISKEIDRDPRAAYFRQMQNGMYIRMAILKMLLCN